MWYIYIMFTIYIYIYNLLSGIIYVCICKDHIYVSCGNFCTHIYTKTIVVIKIQQTISGKNTCHTPNRHTIENWKQSWKIIIWKLKGNCSSFLLFYWQDRFNWTRMHPDEPKGISLRADILDTFFNFSRSGRGTLFKSRTARTGTKMQIKRQRGEATGTRYTCSPTRRSNLSRTRLRSRWYGEHT